MNWFIISDFHYGKYTSDSDKWLLNMNSYFYEFFIPHIQKYAKPGDKLAILGDIFDNRNSISQKALTSVVKLFEKLSTIIECHVILGNHDMFSMSDPEINAVVSIRNIRNVYVYEKPTLLNIDNTSILFMPWIHGKNNEKQVLEQYSGTDLLFCHSDLNGCRTQLYPTRPLNREILNIKDFNGFKKVYSGHIHIVQEINNFTFVGSPYHLDRNDVENTKGIWVYNTSKKEDTFIENSFSPEFKKIKIFKDKDFELLNNELKTQNFIDIEISQNLFVNSPHLRLELDKITNKHKIENIDYVDDIVKEIKPKTISYNKNMSIKDVSFEWVDKLKFNKDTDLFSEIEFKNKLKETVENVFNLQKLSQK